MNKYICGNKSTFAIEYSFFDKSRETEISMFIQGKNILAYKLNGKGKTTRWNLDDLSIWLRNFIEHMCDDPFPVAVDGEFAAIKDDNARNFDSDDEQVFDEYYDKLEDWNLRHRWHTESNGAILADLYFQEVNNMVEISWNNNEPDDGVEFNCKFGGTKVSKEEFITVVNEFLVAYANHWFPLSEEM